MKTNANIDHVMYLLIVQIHLVVLHAHVFLDTEAMDCNVKVSFRFIFLLFSKKKNIQRNI